jgi:hypothetical protein
MGKTILAIVLVAIEVISLGYQGITQLVEL